MTHVLRYLLIFGDRKKKVELSVSEEVENVKVETLKQKARELFSLKNVLLQIWDKGFEDWVDLDEGDPTPTNSRIKVEIDKEARSVADVTLAKRMPSSVTVAKPALVVSTSNAGPPVLQVLSSQSSYPPVALTTTEVSLVAATQKSLPPLARLPPHSQSVSPKPSSSGVPQRTLPVSQRQYLGEQPQGSQALGHGASSSVGKPILVGEDIQNESNITPRACRQPSPAAPGQSQDRPVLDYIQQSFSLPSRSPDRTFPRSQEDAPLRITTSCSQNKTSKEELQQSLPEPCVQSSQIPEKSVPLCHEGGSYRLRNSHLQDGPVIKNLQHSFPVSSTECSRVSEKTIPPYQDNVPHQHMTSSHGQHTPEVQVVHDSDCPMPFTHTSGTPGKVLPPSHDLSLHRPTTTNSQNKPVGPFVQESYSLQPNIQNSQTPSRNLPPSQGQVPPPIVVEDESPPGRDHEDEQGEDIICDPSMERDKLLYSDYKLPKFPAVVVRKLKNGISLKARDVSVLLDKLYESVVPYTYYPSPSDYLYLTRKLLDQFPQLIQQAGLIKDCTDKWEAWRQKLMHKFKNKRKRQDRDAPGVLQQRMNRMKHFEDLDEHQSAAGQGQHGREDLIDSYCPSDDDDEVFEVVDDVQDVMIKEEEEEEEEEEESVYHVMPADTTNLGDTPDIGVTAECRIPPPNSQTSRIPEGIVEPFQDHPNHQQNTSQQQDSHVMKCTQINEHLGTKVMDVVQGSCSSRPHMQTTGFPERSLPQSADHSEDKVPNLLAMPHSQNQTVVEVEQQVGSSASCGQTSKISNSSSRPCQDQEEIVTEVLNIKSAASCTFGKPSLYNYKLPEFPADIIQKLEIGIPIEAKDRSILLDTLYESVVPYTYYPSAADYIYLASIFLERYPQLIPQAGPIQNCQDMVEAWRQKLMHKFKNRRKRKDRDAPAVREHTRKNFRYFEGLDELQSSDGQNLNERGDWIGSDSPDEADDEIFEIMDDDQDVSFEEEHSKNHVMAADTTHLRDLPDKGVVRNVRKSISSSPSTQSQGISERSFPFSQDNAFHGSTSSHPQNKPVKDIFQESTSGIPEKNLPFSRDNASYLLASGESPNKPVMDSFYSQPYMQTSRIPERTLPPSQAGPPTTAVEENFLLSTGQSEKQTNVPCMESTTSSVPHKPSLYNYKLPEFPSDIMRKLKRGIPIEARDRSVLLDVLYESIVPYTYYPSSSDYIYFTNIFLEQFPQLLPQAGPIQNCSDNWEAWKQKLMHKFKNRRKRQDRHALALREHTRKNVRYFEGLDELQGTSEQDLDERRDVAVSSHPDEADDDDVFEVVDVVEDIVIKKEEPMYHVMPADTTNFGDTSEMS